MPDILAACLRRRIRIATGLIKTSVPEGAYLSKPGTLIRLDEFLQLKPAAEKRSAEFQDKRYPKIAGAPAGACRRQGRPKTSWEIHPITGMKFAPKPK